jgi:hypothetical protein
VELGYASEFCEIFIDICGDDPQYLGSVVILAQGMRVAGKKASSKTFDVKGEGSNQ